MGQQAYEAQLQRALRGEPGHSWSVRDLSVIPMRARAAAAPSISRRIPLGATSVAPYSVAAGIGAISYGRSDLVHRLDLRCPPSGRREILTIHDLPPLRFDDEGSIPRWAARSARAAAAVICPSAFAKAEIEELLGVQEVHVIPYGIDHRRADAEPFSPAELEELGLRPPFVIHAAGATNRKNLGLLAEAWPQVLREHPSATLALCGPEHPTRNALFQAMPNTRLLGFRAPDFMARVIRSASAVAVPSTYEGFGLPVLEAMIAGTPAVAVSCGALPEVAGDGAIMVHPESAAFAAALSATLSGGAAIDKIRSAGLTRAKTFSWQTCARDTIALYDALLARSQS